MTSPLIEDIEWLAETGAGWEEAAQRVGLTPSTLARRLHRHRRRDLVAALTENTRPARLPQGKVRG